MPTQQMAVGGDVEYVSTDTSSADNGCTIFVDAAGHRYYRDLGQAMPVEDCGVSINNTAGANATALNAAIQYGPYELDMATAGTYMLTGVVMSGTYPHMLKGGGPDGPSYIYCTGIAYAYASQLTGTLLASDSVCFQNGVQSTGSDKWVLDHVRIVANGSTTIAVAIGDSTTQSMFEGVTCRDSFITGYVGLYWGNSNQNAIDNCNIQTNVANGYGEFYEAPNVAGLVGAAIQNIIHIGGAIFGTTSGSTTVGMLDSGSKGTIGGNMYLAERIIGGSGNADCVTSVPSSGETPANFFYDIGFENCGPSGTGPIYSGSGSYFFYPGAETGNTLAQLWSDLGNNDQMIAGFSSYLGPASPGSPLSNSFNIVVNGVPGRLFTGSTSPNGNITAVEAGDTYLRVGSGATVANSTCKASAANNSSWYEVSSPSTAC